MTTDHWIEPKFGSLESSFGEEGVCPRMSLEWCELWE